MITTTIRQAAQEIKRSAKHGITVLMAGPPGIGKTQVCKQVSMSMDADLIVLHPAISDPTDFKGYLMNTSHGPDFIPTADLQSIIGATKKTIVLLDDFGQAPMAVQAAAMQLVYGGYLNGKKIPGCVSFVIATNRVEDKAGVSGLIEPIKNRAKILSVSPDLKEWVDDFANKKFGNDMELNVHPMVTLFTKYSESRYWNQWKPSREMVNSPTPRTLEMFSRELYDAMESGESWVRSAAGLCGEAWAVEFQAFVAVAGEVPSYDEIVRNPGKAKVMDTVGGRYSSVDMLANNVKKDDVEAIFGYLGRFPDNDRNEFKAMFANQAIRRNPEIINTKAFDKFMVEFQEMMK